MSPLRACLGALLVLAGCAQTRSPASSRARVEPAGRRAAERPTPVSVDRLVGRWIAVDVVGDAEATRDLRRGSLEKVLVVNPGGHVLLRGVDRARGRGAAESFSGRLVGDRLRFDSLAGAASLTVEGTRLLLTDPTGRVTRFVRAAE